MVMPCRRGAVDEPQSGRPVAAQRVNRRAAAPRVITLQRPARCTESVPPGADSGSRNRSQDRVQRPYVPRLRLSAVGTYSF